MWLHPYVWAVHVCRHWLSYVCVWGGGGQLVSVMITLHGRWMKGGYIFIHYSCVGAFVHAWHIVEWACVKCILLFKLYD